MDWTLAPLVALVLCNPHPGPTDEQECLHFRSAPWVECMRRATAMNQARRGPDSPLATCIRLDAVKVSK